MKIVQGAIQLLLFPLMGAIMVNGSIISSSTSRLPMSISTIITDLEAEGVTQLSTATILTSRSVSSSDRSTLLQNIFHDGAYDEDEDEENLDQATAFGKKLGADDEEKVGIAIANPSASTGGANEAALTVLSTHGTIIFICNPVDLQREEGLFQSLAPSIERLLMQRYEQQQSATEGGANDSKSAEMIVIFQGMDSSDAAALNQAKAKFEKAATAMLANIVKPDTSSSRSLSDVFETIEYLSESTASSSSVFFRTLMEGKGQLLEPWDAAASVASAVASDSGAGRITSKLNTVDLAAGRKLGPIARKALDSTIARIHEATTLEEGEASDSESSNTKFVTNFGVLVDATISQSLAEFDEITSSSTALQKSSLTKRKRSELLEQMYVEIGDVFDLQLAELKTACFDSFRKGLSKLRVSPTLPQDMQKVADDAVTQFAKQSKLLLPHKNGASAHISHWSSAVSAKIQFQRRLKEYCIDRLNAARASGNYRPLPRKGVTIGLHWLLPKPFGNDYRLSPSDVYSGGQLVYSPSTNKLAEVGEEEVKKGTGDWRRRIVPVPGGADMMYQFGTNSE